jgi:hypothetical protein
MGMAGNFVESRFAIDCGTLALNEHALRIAIEAGFAGMIGRSPSGQSRRFDDIRVMSAFPLIATE